MAERQVKEHEHVEDLDGYEVRSGCFRHYYFQWQQSNNGENRGYLLLQKGEHREMTLLVKKLKNFIRSIISKYLNTKKAKSTTQFQYDPHSYALNFDIGTLAQEEHCRLPSFSSRFAAPRSGQNPGAVLSF